MLLLGDIGNKELSEKLANHLTYGLSYPDIHVFPDGEIRVRILDQVTGKDVLLLKSISPPVNENFTQFLLIIDALKKNGAHTVTGIVPYLGYARADHIFRSGEGVPLEVVISTIEVTGLDKILIVDPHSIKTPEVFKIPVINTSALSLFAVKIKEIENDLTKISIVSPDMGGIRRIKILSEMLGGAETSVVNKERNYETGEISLVEIEGKLNETCFVVDDMISSANTMVQAITELEKRGVNQVYAMATHAVFSDKAPVKLSESRAKKVFVTDTNFIPEEKRFEKLEILSISRIVANKIKVI